MINGCRHLKILELILDFTIYENAMKMKCSRGISLILVLRKILEKRMGQSYERRSNTELQNAVFRPVVPQDGEEVSVLKARIKFRKYGCMKFIGHLDVMRFFQK